MEYQTPSMFDENGFNILSPTVQMMRGEGFNSSPQSSFRYNGESPQQTAMYNNMNPYNGYYNQQSPPPGFTAMNQPMYGEQYQQQSYNPYATMQQQNNYGYAYSYQPNNSYYTDSYTPNFYDRIVEEGNRIGDGIVHAMTQNVQQQQVDQYGNNDHLIKTDMWGRPIGEYSYQEIKEMNAPIYNHLYRTGAMSLSDYCSLNNGGISFIGVDGKTVRVGASDNWFVGSERIQRQKQMMAEQQRLYEEQMDTWNVCMDLNKKYLMEEGRTDELNRINTEQSVQYQEYMQKLQKYHYDIIQYDNWYDNMCRYVDTWQRSDQPGYVTPLNEKYINDWNKLYERRTKDYPKSYGVDEFFNQGIMECQIIDDMAHDAEIEERKVDILYSRERFRQDLHMRVPAYDPVTGTAAIPVSMNVSDIEITLPEHLKRERYIKRRQAFENTIFRDNRFVEREGIPIQGVRG